MINNTKSKTLPFINESLTKGIVDLKIFLHENIYCDDTCMEILENELRRCLNIECNIWTAMDSTLKTILIDNCGPIRNKYIAPVSEAFVNAFKNPYIKSKLELCKNSYKEDILNDTSSIKLIFNIITMPPNILKVYL